LFGDFLLYLLYINQLTPIDNEKAKDCPKEITQTTRVF
jgi:hypothetical protein